MDEATFYQMNESLYSTNKFPGCIDSAALEEQEREKNTTSLSLKNKKKKTTKQP